jgi:hypothetical protein
LNSSMTKTYSECLDFTNDDVFVEWMRSFLLESVNKRYESDAMLEYRYVRLTSDLLEAKTVDEIENAVNELMFGHYEKKRSLILERMFATLDMMRTEQDKEWFDRFEQHYESLDKELGEVERSCKVQTKY